MIFDRRCLVISLLLFFNVIRKWYCNMVEFVIFTSPCGTYRLTYIVTNNYQDLHAF